MRDILLTKNEYGIYDFSFDGKGDFTNTEGLDTSIIISLFTDARAAASEVPSPEFRRGWLGNELNSDPDHVVGSKLWLLSQARSNQNSANSSESYTNQCFDWMVKDKIVKKIETSSIIDGSKIKLMVTFTRFDETTFSSQFVLWENTEIV